MQLLARNSIRIVHIDDDNDFAEISARGLRRAGFDQPIVRCTNGLLALDYFSMIDPQSAPHVILLDLHMPLMNGLEVLHWVRQNYSDRDVAVYLLTSSENPAHKRQAMTDGVTGYLLKSSLVDTLVEKLDCLIIICNNLRLKQVNAEQSASVKRLAAELQILSPGIM